MIAAVAVFGLAELLIAPLHNVVAVGALLFVCGVCFTTYTSNSNATVQLETPDHIRGRVLGIYFYAWNGPLPLASPLIGWLCVVGGTELAFAFGGVCALAAAAAAAVAIRRAPARQSSRRPASSPARCRSDRPHGRGRIPVRAATRSSDSPDVVLLVTGVVACTTRSPTPLHAANAPVDGGGRLRG